MTVPAMQTKTTSKGIVSWPADERPRERLLLHGPHAVTDAELTRDLIAACQPIGVKVLDHVIVTEQEHYSFADAGLLDELRLEVVG